MSGKAGWREVAAGSNESLTRFFSRTGWEPTSTDLPFSRIMDAEDLSFPDMIAAADDGEDGKAGEYEIRQRMLGVRTFLRFLKKRAITPMDMFRQLAAAGRAMHEEPFSLMSMDEVAMMEGQGKAAHSWRCKIMSGEIELAGMKGSKLPGQKSKKASEAYKKARKGNNNRKGGNKAKRHAARQQSFLRKLKVQPKPKHDE